MWSIETNQIFQWLKHTHKHFFCHYIKRLGLFGWHCQRVCMSTHAHVSVNVYVFPVCLCVLRWTIPCERLETKPFANFGSTLFQSFHSVVGLGERVRTTHRKMSWPRAGSSDIFSTYIPLAKMQSFSHTQLQEELENFPYCARGKKKWTISGNNLQNEWICHSFLTS